jgi:hypothetical protein
LALARIFGHPLFWTLNALAFDTGKNLFLKLIVRSIQVRRNRRLILREQPEIQISIASRHLRNKFALRRHSPILARINGRSIAADFADVARVALGIDN